MTSKTEIQHILDIQLDPDVFATLDVPGMPESVYQKPHELFESMRQRCGDLVEVVNGKVDGVPFPSFGSRDSNRRELEMTRHKMLHRLPNLRIDADMPVPRIRGVISRSAASVRVLASA